MDFDLLLKHQIWQLIVPEGNILAEWTMASPLEVWAPWSSPSLVFHDLSGP